MPSGVEVDLEVLKKSIIEVVKSFVKGDMGFKVTPIAFGLKALDIAMIIDEDSDDAVQQAITDIDGVQNISVLSASLT